MSFDNGNAPTVTLADAEARHRVQDDLDLHDDPVLAQRIVDYMEQKHECPDDPPLCDECSRCDCCRNRI